MLSGLEVPFWLGPAPLLFYPLVFYFLVGFCSGEFTDVSTLLQGHFSGLEFGGKVLKLEGIVIAVFASWNWLRTLWGGRTYYLPNGDGGHVGVRKWDPDHASLVLSCLLSPVQVAYLLMPDLHKDEEGNSRPTILMLLVAAGHGYMSLALAHMFVKREHLQRKINNSVYALEVDIRNAEVNRRRKAEKEVVEGLMHKSKCLLSAKKAGGSASFRRSAEHDDSHVDTYQI